MTDSPSTPLIAVSVAARNPANGKFLLVRRGRAPARGLWAFPGGRLQFGETLAQAAARELLEETGLTARDIRFHRLFELMSDGSDGDVPHHFVLAVHRAEASGEPVANDDADAAGWFSIEAMAELPITESTLATARAIAERR
ncbi:MAG: NUDIX hydrolase [Oricola sp.]